MQIDQLISQAETELRAWRALEQRIEQVAVDVASINQQKNEAEQSVQALTWPDGPALVDRWRQITDTLPNVCDEVKEVIGELAATQETFRSAVQELMGDWDEFDDELKQQLADELDSVRSRIEEQLTTSGEAMVEEFRDWLETAQSDLEKAIDVCRGEFEGLGENVSEVFEESAEIAKQSFEDLTGQFRDQADEWTRQVAELRDAFQDVGRNIATLGRDVEMLSSTLTTALSTTGAGMNVAARGLADVKSVLQGVV